MDSWFGDPPVAGGDLHNSADGKPRADPASDGAGSGGVDLFGRLDLALDLEPGFPLENMDSCLQNSSEGYSPGTFEDTDAVPAVDAKVYNREQVLDNSWFQLEPKPVEFSGKVVFGRKFLERLTVRAQQIWFRNNFHCTDLQWFLNLSWSVAWMNQPGAQLCQASV